MSLEISRAQQGSLGVNGCHYSSVELSWGHWLRKDQWRSIGGHWGSLGLSEGRWVSLELSGDQKNSMKLRSLGVIGVECVSLEIISIQFGGSGCH